MGAVHGISSRPNSTGRIASRSRLGSSVSVEPGYNRWQSFFRERHLGAEAVIRFIEGTGARKTPILPLSSVRISIQLKSAVPARATLVANISSSSWEFLPFPARETAKIDVRCYGGFASKVIGVEARPSPVTATKTTQQLVACELCHLSARKGDGDGLRRLEPTSLIDTGINVADQISLKSAAFELTYRFTHKYPAARRSGHLPRRHQGPIAVLGGGQPLSIGLHAQSRPTSRERPN